MYKGSVSSISRTFCTTTKSKPFRVLGVQQIALGSTDRSALQHLWINLFDAKHVTSFESVKENVSEDVTELGYGPYAVEIDLMEPLDPEKSPKVHIPPLNHIGLWIDDLPAAVKWLGEQGVRFAPGGIRPGASGHDICFIHPKGNEASPISGQGVLIELVQAPPNVIEAHSVERE